jgi:hypothetical protein
MMMMCADSVARDGETGSLLVESGISNVVLFGTHSQGLTIGRHAVVGRGAAEERAVMRIGLTEICFIRKIFSF